MVKADIVAIVPMRHTSHRVPGKNYRPFNGRPLYHRIIETLLEASSISKVVIDTDSPRIQEDAGFQFPEVQVFERPEALCGDRIPTNDVLLNTIEQVDADFYLQTHSTNPLLRSDTIDKAVKTFLESYPTHDSLFSVTRLQTRLWNQMAQPINHNPAILLRTQDLPPVYEENSNLYLFSAEVLCAERSRIGRRPLLFEMDAEEAWDIDEETDFRLAELLYQQREGADG